jgi:hypothetical protein
MKEKKFRKNERKRNWFAQCTGKFFCTFDCFFQNTGEMKNLGSETINNLILNNLI